MSVVLYVLQYRDPYEVTALLKSSLHITLFDVDERRIFIMETYSHYTVIIQSLSLMLVAEG